VIWKEGDTMPERLTLDDIFEIDRKERLAQLTAEDTPGTPEYATKQAFVAAHKKRVADGLERVIAAGGVIGVTHDEEGNPLADPDEDEEDEEEDWHKEDEEEDEYEEEDGNDD
jgi:hypothetical protein